MSRDITERKQIDQTLQSSESQYRRIIESIGDALHVIDKDFRVILVNSALEKWVKSMNLQINLVGKNLFEAVPFLKDNIYKEYQHVFETGEIIITIETTYINKEEILTETRKIPIILDGKTTQIITIIRDITERKKAEQKLRESEEKYRNLFNSSPLMIALVSLDGKIVDVNSECLKSSMYDKEEFLGMDFIHIAHMVPKEEQEFIKEVYKKILKTGNLEPVELQVRKKNETLIWITMQASLVKIENETLIQLVMQDITKRKEAEESLKKAGREKSSILEAITESIMYFDTDQRIVWANRVAANIANLSIEKLIGHKCFELFYNKKEPCFGCPIINVLKTGIPKMSEVNSPDGKVFLVRGYPILDDNGNVMGAVDYSREITEINRAEIMLKESLEIFKNIAEQSFMGIVILQDEQIKYVNNAAARIFEYSNDEVLNWSKDYMAEMCIHPEDLQLLRETRKRRRNEEFNVKPYVSYRVITKSRKIKWIDQYSKRISYQGKEAELVTFMEITEKKEAEKLIIEENKKLLELNQMRDDLISRTSHELKTPLSSIYGGAQLLLNSFKDQVSEEALEFIEMIYKGAKRLKILVENLLDVSKLESGKLSLDLKTANLVEIIRNCVIDVKYLANERNLNLSANLPKEIYLKVDKIRIEQVITNLLSNAIKNTPPMGKVSVNLEDKDDCAYISVKDTGVGFIKEEVELLFTKFGKIERYGKGMNIDIEGSGLGLFFSKEIVNLHNGTIWVESEGRNKGSTFIVRLLKNL